MLNREPKFYAEKENIAAKTSLWNQSGPLLLLAAFAILVFKCAPFFVPLLLSAFIGYVASLIWKKKGFYFSLMILAAVSFYTIQSGVDPFWSLLLSTSIALSWLLICLGKLESDAIAVSREEKIKILEKNQDILEKQIREAKASLSEENKENILERERLNHLYGQAVLDLSQTKQSLQVSEQEREKVDERCETLSQDIFAYQRREIAFQHALDDAQAQLLKLKNQQLAVSTNIIPQEEVNPQEKIQLEQVHHQHALLREQFEEKSESLDKARKELFRVENELLALQKAHEEKSFETSEEVLHLTKDLKRLEEECCDLDVQVCGLQEFIFVLIAPKKRTIRSRKPQENQERLPLLIEELLLQKKEILRG
jgi:hypothetical protein